MMLKFLAAFSLFATPAFAARSYIEPLPTTVFSGSWTYADQRYGLNAFIHTGRGRYNELYLEGPNGLSTLYVFCSEGKVHSNRYSAKDESIVLLEQLGREWCASPYAVEIDRDTWFE